MQRTLTITATDWPGITNQVMSHVNDAQFVQAGIWQLTHVELTIPLAMANANNGGHLELIRWLENERLGKRITAARRADIALLLTFEKSR